jgi:hypothetical protein
MCRAGLACYELAFRAGLSVAEMDRRVPKARHTARREQALMAALFMTDLEVPDEVEWLSAPVLLTWCCVRKLR